MEFTFLGNKIIIDKTREQYVKILEGYYEVAVEYQKRWEIEYKKAGSLSRAIEIIRKDYAKFHNALMYKTMELLDEREGIVDADRSTFNKYYKKYLGKGYLEDAFNAIEERIEADPECNVRYYENVDVFSYWREVIKNDALSTVNVYIQFVLDKKGRFYGKSSSEERQKVEAILKKIESSHMTKREIREKLCECMCFDPFADGIYFNAIKYFGDEEHTIEKIARQFFVNANSIKNDLMTPIMEEIEEAFEDEDAVKLEEWIELKEKIEKAKQFYGYEVDDTSEVKETLDMINEIIEEYLVDDKDQHYLDIQNSGYKQFEFLEYNLKISESTILYNEVLKFYRAEADNQVKKLKDRYHSAGDIDTVVKYIESWGTELLTETARKMLDSFGKMGIYSIDINTVNKKYSLWIDFDSWKNAIEQFVEKYAQCIYSEEQMKKYREQRKASRGRFVGGGFGVSGAIKGSMQAGMLNMATGAAHSIVNTIGNISSDMKINSNKRNLYSKSSTINELCDALYVTTISILNVYTKVVWDEKGIYIGAADRAESDKANAINDSIKNNRCPKEDISKLLAESICLDVYNKETYTLAIQIYGDSNGKIAEMAKFFLIDADKIKEELMKNFLKSIQYDLHSLETPKDLNSWENRKAKIQEQEKWLGHTSNECQQIYEFIEKEMLICKERLKIVDGKKYDTVDMAADVKHDLGLIYEIADNLEYSLEDASRYLVNLEFKNEETELNKQKILEKRRKFKLGDADEIEERLLKIKSEIIDLPHNANKYSRCSVAIEGYLENRYFDRKSSKYNEIAQKISKVIITDIGEKMLVFLTMLTGTIFNDVGLVITNKKLYFIEGKRVLFSKEWSLIDKILVEKGKYIIYTTDSKIFSNEMKGIDTEYICRVMNEYFECIVNMFTCVYPREEKSFSIRNIDKNEIIACCKELKRNVWKYVEWIGYSYNGKYKIVYLYGDTGFEEKIDNIKEAVGSTLINDIPLVFYETERNGGNKMLITDKSVYWFDDSGFQRTFDWSNMIEIRRIRKGIFSEKIIADMQDGTQVELPIADLYFARLSAYAEMLNLAKITADKINQLE